MIWRRVLVPETMSLHELHGVLQVAAGWAAIHLFQFSVRVVVYAGPHLHGQTVDVPLSDFRFPRNAKFRYAYDMRCWWEHELRVEDRVSAVLSLLHLLLGSVVSRHPESVLHFGEVLSCQIPGE